MRLRWPAEVDRHTRARVLALACALAMAWSAAQAHVPIADTLQATAAPGRTLGGPPAPTRIGPGIALESVVPVEKEPHHRVAFENRWVRVLDVNFPAGAASLFHRHALHNVAIRIVGGTTRTDPVGGEGRSQHVPTGRVVFYSASPPYEHRVVNVGPAAVRILDIELFGARTEADTGASDDLAGHSVEVENEHVRVTRVQVGPGESVPAHTHQRGWLAVVVAGPSPGTFGWNRPGSRASVGDPAQRVDVVEIEPKSGMP